MWGKEQTDKFMKPAKTSFVDDEGWTIEEVEYTKPVPQCQFKPRRRLRDPGEFLVVCRFWNENTYSKLLDSGASVNTMPAIIAKSLGIRELVRTNTGIRFGNQTVDKPIRIEKDVALIIHGVGYKEDFFIMDCAPDEKTPIVLGRVFLATA
ncbi:uncharacterized protein [Rutidosis leptorrhynchoides]|uniref:uncharacterized protein n=1 Tax=Rutidosis leptorrhynchoides TaxID=125765 RepID=UPI003A99B078